MNRWITAFLCLLLLSADASAQAVYGTISGRVYIDWEDGTSHGEMQITGLPAVPKQEKDSSMATGRRTYEPIVIRKRVDKYSPRLQLAFETKKRLPRVVIRARDRRSGKRIQYTLYNVSVSNYSISNDGELPASDPAGSDRITIIFTDFDFH